MKKGLILAVLAVFLAAGCATSQQVVQPQPALGAVQAPAPIFKVNDEWTYKDSYRNETTIKVVEFTENEVITASSNRPNCKEIRNRNFTLKKLECEGTAPFVNTGFRYLDFPLYVGKSWQYSEMREVPSRGTFAGYAFMARVTAMVTAYEKIKLPFEEFECFRIEMDVMGADLPLLLTYWYSPQVKAIIKWVLKNSVSPDRELVRYK
ncbi:MAG: hypothetical protein KKH04_15505 [Proteobacteria bacterium]|nr:hypothetical protein [Pseudomonadota bacterium]